MKTYCECCGQTYPNDDELAFHFWCVEARKFGYIGAWIYQYPTFPLSEKRTKTVEKRLKTKTKTVERVVLRGHSYTSDFMIVGPCPELCRLPEFAGKKPPVYPDNYIDVKPKFEPRHSRTEAFRINQKWVADKYGVLVHAVVPSEFFSRTWVPEKIAFKKNGGRRKPYSGCWLVDEMGWRV